MDDRTGREGYADAFLNCGGTGYPPYAVKWRGRWWLTDWVRAGNTGNTEATRDVLQFVRSLGPLRHGTSKFKEYLRRNEKRLSDIPKLTTQILESAHD